MYSFAIIRNVTSCYFIICSLFSLNDTPTTEIYTLSLHDALPISALVLAERKARQRRARFADVRNRKRIVHLEGDRKSTRLNSSHLGISYAVFCLKKKNEKQTYVRSTYSSKH